MARGEFNSGFLHQFLLIDWPDASAAAGEILRPVQRPEIYACCTKCDSAVIGADAAQHQSMTLASQRLGNMVIPLVGEEEWKAVLTKAESWSIPSTRILIIAPHPDDETLAAGGLIAACSARQQEVLVAAVTDGENAYDDFPNLARIRREEQENALARLGVVSQHICRFELPDSDVTSRESELVERLLPLVSADTHVVAPWEKDFHPDHEVCGRAAQQVAARTGATLTFYFFWTWHRGTPALLQGLPLLALELTDAQRRAKMEALSEHSSQLQHHSGEPVLPDSLLWPARLPFEVFLSA